MSESSAEQSGGAVSTPAAGNAAATTEAASAAGTAPPPWGDDFDPQRAWDKIQKANREAASLRKQVSELQPRAEQFNALEEASKTEVQRMQEALEAANRSRDEAQGDALRLRIAHQHKLETDDLDLLGVGDEETLTARAERLAALRSAARASEEAPRPPQRPVEQLRPGATPAQEATSIPDDAYPVDFLPRRARERIT